MTVLMTSNQRYPLDGARLRIEWQGLGPDEQVSAQVFSGAGAGPVFPQDRVPGLRQQPYVGPGNWLLDLTALGPDVTRVDVVVESPRTASLSLAVEVTDAAPAEVLQHPGLTTVARAPMLALRLQRSGADWAVAAFDTFVDPAIDPTTDDGPSVPVPESLREPVMVARHEDVVGRGEKVTAVVDVSASMRPRLAAGTVAGVLTGLQAVAGAAGQRGVDVVAVSDRAYGPRTLSLSDDPEEFLRGWVGEIGLRAGVRETAEQWVGAHTPDGLVVSVSDQETAGSVALPAGRRSRIVLLPPDGQGGVSGRGTGTVVLTEERPDPAAIVRALAHASPPR